MGKAVARNLLKRRIKAIFYEEKLSSIPVKTVFLAKPAATQVCFAALKKIILSYFSSKAF